MPVVRVLIALVSALASPPAPVHDPPRTVRVADGIYVFVTPPYGDVGLDGNPSRSCRATVCSSSTRTARRRPPQAVLAEIRG